MRVRLIVVRPQSQITLYRMNLLFERRAEIALRSLRGVDQKQISRALRELEAIPPKELFRHPKIHKVSSIPDSPALYIYGGRIRLHLILAIEGETCTVLDVVDHDRLHRLLPKQGQR